MYSLALIIFVVSEKKAFENFRIGSNVNLSCSSDHLGFLIGIKKLNFAEDLPMIILGQFGFICPSGFREETNSCCSRHLPFYIGTKKLKFVEDHPMNIHVQFSFDKICSF